ncbi:MAG: arabinogalactan endo-beta-1,4-galactanase [Candidatus Krumholzibacteriia bacterium]
MAKLPLILLLFRLLIGAAFAGPAEFTLGADVSFLPQVEAGGGVFREDGVPVDPLVFIRNCGLEMVRLRLWHAPADGHSGLAEALALGRRAKAAGLGILLDFHYSDTWADPGSQTKPAAWAGLPFPDLADSMHTYTRDVLTAFADLGVAPTVVQIGNEISPGMLWDDGRVDGGFDTPTQWARLAQLIRSGIAGVDEALPGALRPQVMIHLDRGGDNGASRWFFDNLIAQGVDFDLIGLSYYPWWHGDLADLEGNLSDLAGRYGKGLMVVETAYPWTLGWFDETHNVVGLPDHLLPGYPATPAGQAAFLTAVLDVVQGVPDGLGRGLFIWAPEWIAAPGLGSSWENLALFDQEGRALPAWNLDTAATLVR